MKRLRFLWNDVRGYTSGVSLILVVTIMGLGTIVGLATVRDHLTQELGDVAAGLRQLNQSFAAPCYGKFVDDPPEEAKGHNPQPEHGGEGFEFATRIELASEDSGH